MVPSPSPASFAPPSTVSPLLAPMPLIPSPPPDQELDGANVLDGRAAGAADAADAPPRSLPSSQR